MYFDLEAITFGTKNNCIPVDFIIVIARYMLHTYRSQGKKLYMSRKR